MSTTTEETKSVSTSKTSDEYTFSILNESGVKAMVTLPYATDDDSEGEGLSSNYQVLTLFDDTTYIESESTTENFPETEPTDYNEDNLPTTVSAQVELDETYTNADGNTETQLIYNLVFFRNGDNWFFPVLNTAATNILGWSWDREYYTDSEGESTGVVREKVMTIYDTDVTAMTQTEKFLKAVAANPSSKMATEYYAALSSAESAASSSSGSTGNSTAESMSSAITDVTSQYDDYKYVSLDTITTVQSYFNTVPYVFAKYQENQYYYFYSSDSGSTVLVGRMDIIKNNEIATNSANGGYKITYYPATDPSDTSKYDVDTSNGVDIIYKDGYFYDEAGTRLYVAGSFIVKSTVTNKAADTSTIIPVLAGAIDGHQNSSAVGSDSIITDSSSSSGSKDEWAESWKNLGPIGQLIIFFMAAQVFVFPLFVYLVKRWWKARQKGKKTQTDEDQNKDKDEADNEAKEDADNYNEYRQKTGTEDTKLEITDSVTDVNFSDIVTSAQTNMTSATNTIKLEKLNEDIQTTDDTLKETAKFEQDMDTDQLKTLESGATDLQTVSTAAEKVDVTSNKTSDTISKLYSSDDPNDATLSRVNSSMQSLETEVVQNINTDASNQIKTNTEVIDNAIDNAEKVNENENENEDGDFDGGEFSTPFED